jgi:hypothetical protein
VCILAKNFMNEQTTEELMKEWEEFKKKLEEEKLDS